MLAAVARHGSVTEARELHNSRPSVSHHLARLETATGARLVQRIGRGIRLTPEGRLLAHRAAEVVSRVDAAAEPAAQVGLQAHRRADVQATETGFSRRIYAATYGEPPDPPAVPAALTDAASGALA